jgi:hypothetical protein
VQRNFQSLSTTWKTHGLYGAQGVLEALIAFAGGEDEGGGVKNDD